MEIWKDASAFESGSLQPHHTDGATRYYHAGEFKYSKFIPMPDKPEWSMLWGDGMYREEWAEGSAHRRENADFLSIEYVEAGDLLFRQDGRMYLLEAGDIGLMLPGMDAEMRTGPGGYCRKSSLLMVGPLLNDMLARSGLAEVDVIENIDGRRLENIFGLFEDMSRDFGDSAYEKIDRLSYEVLLFLSRRGGGKSLPRELEKLLAFMDESLAQCVTLDDLVAEYGGSMSRLIRHFKEYLNTTPYRMMTTLRMREAARLLMEQDLLVKEIAARVGYDNALNFSTEFKKYFGVSPRDYRMLRGVGHGVN